MVTFYKAADGRRNFSFKVSATLLKGAGGVRATIALHCSCRIFKMAVLVGLL